MPIVHRSIAWDCNKCQRLYFVAFCESVSVASRNEKCQTRLTVGFLVPALIGTPAAAYASGELPRPV